MDNKPQFVHLHVHSHYSILDGMSKVPDLIAKSQKCGMNAIALTDHGNMFGTKEFTDEVKKVNGKIKGKIAEKENILKSEEATDEEKTEAEKEIEKLKKSFFKPIIGVEAYCARRTLYDKDKNHKMINPETGKEVIVDSSGYHLILLAKNKKGYQNLCKLVSIAWIDGNYHRPRIDKNILQQYKEGIIVCSACLGGEIDQHLIAGNYEKAKETVEWFKNIFGDDYYLEIMRHKTDKPNADTKVYERQEQINPDIIRLAKETGVKLIATNDVHFVEEEHGEAHDRLICLSTGKMVKEENRMHYTKQEWLKTPEEMLEIFSDIPEALSNTLEIAEKVEVYSIDSGPLMPKFDIPEDFGTEEVYREKITEEDLFNEFTQDEKGNVVLSKEDAESKIKKLGGYEKLYRIKLEADYLAKLAWEGARKRYGDELTEEQKERITFELHIMKTMGFPGYFLIVMDYIRAAREELGVSVGPGRGSAAGSVVAYCLWITDVDPLKYDLLFERFLNPDRISLPDIDVDFDDEGRGKVLQWVTQKYGKERVAHIITYGTMATKMAIADVSRVQEIPLPLVNEIKKCIPEKFDESVKDEKGKSVKVKIKNCIKYSPEFKKYYESSDSNVSSMIKYAADLEDTVRQTGIHACGVIIGADDLTNFAPISTVKDKSSNDEVMVTQYDGHYVESVGLIKMDFLGLKTLSIIKEAIKNIKISHNVEIDIDKIPIDDELTYKLYSDGATVGTFQFESPGMQKYLKQLQPTVFEDLIAMNALYRPGPMDYIPTFINRKTGKEAIEYDIPEMEKYLKDTYGVTVYQEQVMLLSRLLADFTRGESDTLRKAMGKKQLDTMAKLHGKFVEGGQKNGHKKEILDKIWADWEKFASYALNKSHATCYSWVSYQTAYLKAHYPADFMAANLTQSMDSITDITKFMDECQRMGIKVLIPDVNESMHNFTSNSEGNIRFGLAGIKGLGIGAVDSIIKERDKNGKYADIYDFVERVNLTSCGKKALETLAFAGAFDCFSEVKRENFMQTAFVEAIHAYGVRMQDESGKNQLQLSLFDANDTAAAIKKPKIPSVESLSRMDILNKERDLVGIFLSSHPLDDYYVILKHVCNVQMKDLSDDWNGSPFVDEKKEHNLTDKNICFGGMVVDVQNRQSKKGNEFKIVSVQDYTGIHKFTFFSNEIGLFGNYFNVGYCLLFNGKCAKKYPYDKFPQIITQKIQFLADVNDSAVRNIIIHLNDRTQSLETEEDFNNEDYSSETTDGNDENTNMDTTEIQQGTSSSADNFDWLLESSIRDVTSLINETEEKNKKEKSSPTRLYFSVTLKSGHKLLLHSKKTSPHVDRQFLTALEAAGLSYEINSERVKA
jgi:DNA polymerase-3 subunit alpha